MVYDRRSQGRAVEANAGDFDNDLQTAAALLVAQRPPLDEMSRSIPSGRFAQGADGSRSFLGVPLLAPWESRKQRMASVVASKDSVRLARACDRVDAEGRLLRYLLLECP